MKKLILIILLYPFVSFSQWINFAPVSAGSGGFLIVTSKSNYYYSAYNLQLGKGTLYYTNNSGKNWAELKYVGLPVFYNDSSGYHDAFYMKNPNKKNIFKTAFTHDYAKSWADSFERFPDTANVHEYNVHQNDVFMTFDKSSYNITLMVKNAGKQITKVSDKTLNLIHFINDTIGYGLDKKNFSIYKSTNGGTSWNLISTISGNWPWSAFQFTSEDTAYALPQNANFILKSTNGGMAWDTLKVKDGLYDFKFISCTIGFALGYELPDYLNRAYYTLDGGNSWKQLGNDITSKNIRKLDLVYDKDSIYFFFSFPGGGVTNLYKGSFAFKDILAGMPEKPLAQKTNYSCYPNPASDILTIKCENEIPCLGKISVINLQGQVLLSQNIHNQANEIDVSRLARGVYFVKVVDEKGVWVSKVVKE